MSQQRFRVPVLVLTVLFAWAAGSVRAVELPFEKAGDNLCTGGDFEGDALSRHWKWTDNGGTFSVKVGSGRVGSAAELVSTGTANRGKFYHTGFSLPAGSDIRVSLWVKAQGHLGGTWVNYEGPAGEGFAKFDLAGGTYDWTEYVHRTTVPTKAVAKGQPARLELWFYVYGAGKLFIDDVECRVIEHDAKAEAGWIAQASGEARAASIRSDRPAAIGVLATDGTTRVFRDLPFCGRHASAVELDICRHEFEGVQLLIFAHDRDLADVQVSVSDLEGPGEIPAASVQVLPVAYCDRSEAPPIPWYVGESSRWWPDPLLPNRPFKVEKGTVQPVYLRFYCPKDAKPGEYSGSVEVKTSAGAATMPVRLTVWDVTMPTRLHLKTMSVGGKKEKPYVDFALEQRLPIGNLYAGMSWAKPSFPAQGDSFDFSKVEADLQYAIDRGLNAFIMASAPKPGRWGFPEEYSPQWKRDMTKVIREYGVFLKSKGWWSLAYFNNIDEPSPGRWEQCKDIYKMVKAADPEVKVFHCVNTLGALDALKGFADTWDVYVQQADQQQAAARQAEGCEIWWALCLWPAEHPNLFVEYPLVDARVIGWAALKYGVCGFEYWSFTSWEGHNPKDASWITCPGGVLTTSWKYTRGRSGDGYLVYPGPNGSPVNSLRLEALRDGFEENELLWQLKERLAQLAGESKAEAQRLLDGGDGLVRNMFLYSHSPADFAAKRRRVLELLTGAGTAPSAPATEARESDAEKGAAKLLGMAR